MSLTVPTATCFSTTESRVALVTGANKGIGREIAKRLAEANIQTILACRTNGKRAAAEIEGSHDIYLDLTDDSSIEKCRDFVEKKVGKLDILVNNAAICFNDPTLYGKVEHTPFERQAHISITTNYFGSRKVTEAMMPLLQKSMSPRIINIASSAGRLGILRSQEKVDMFTDPNLTVEQLDSYMNAFVKAVEEGKHEEWAGTCYGMSKLGIIALSKTLAREYTDLQINSVDPGYCATDQNNNQGTRPAERGAVTPFLLATTQEKLSGNHWFDEQVIPWSYS
jgi:NAD(P)-dependent dehydrogenase (short-subunit alcohol dehydrogenase family)